jgi:hypothetical protein
MRRVGERYTKEGAVQAMLCVNAGEFFSVIDREVVVGYRDTEAKSEVFQRLQDPLLDAVRGRTGPAWWKPPTRLGGELDLLAVDRAGRLLVIEVKPGSALSGIAWSPLQVTFYAELLREWATAVGDEVARATLTRMLDHRVQLGLTDHPLRPLGAPLEIVPVIAIGGDVRPAATERLSAVQSALAREGCAWPNLEIWRVRPGIRREDILLT